MSNNNSNNNNNNKKPEPRRCPACNTPLVYRGYKRTPESTVAIYKCPVCEPAVKNSINS